MVRELLRCLTLLLVIPPGLLLIGPLLLVTAYRGNQRFGPLVFNVRRSGWKGRLTTGLIGITLWVAVWGGLVWWLWPVAKSFDPHYASEGLSSIVTLLPRWGSDESAQRIAATPFLILASATASPTMTPATAIAPALLAHTTLPSSAVSGISAAVPTSVPSMTLAPTVEANAVFTPTVELSPAKDPTMTPTTQPTATVTPVPSPTPTMTPTQSPSPTPTTTPTETPTPTSTMTPTEVPSPTPTMTPTEAPTLTATPTMIPSPTPSHTPTPSPSPTASPTVTATPTADAARQAIAAVERANEALRLALELPSPERLDALNEHWKDRSFPNVRTFVFSIIKLVGRPVRRVSYVYLVPPLATYDQSNGMAYVDAIEIWTYEGSAVTYMERFVFHYVLARREADWVIVDYTYRNAPTAASP